MRNNKKMAIDSARQSMNELIESEFFLVLS